MAPNPPKPIRIERGQWSGGDAATVPEGYLRKLRNCVWEDVWVSRPPFTYDNLTNVRGLGLWQDETNNVVRLVAADATSGVHKLYVKATSGETWSADISGANAFFGTITDSVTFRGKWLAATPSATGGSTPLRVFYYDGTTYQRDAVGLPSSFRPYCLTTFRDRVFYGGALLVSQNLTDDITVYAYDTTNWTLTNVTSSAITATGATRRQITPTNTTTASVSLMIPTGVTEFFGNGQANTVQFRSELRATDRAYRVPITVQIKYSSARQNNYAYTVGQVVVPAASNGYRYRCTVAGTSAGAPPVYPTTVGGTVVDGGVTWINDKSEVAAETQTYINSLSEFDDWTVTRVVAVIPDGAKTDLTLVIKFGNDASPTYTLTPLEFSYIDGLAVADPRKKNHGQQWHGDAFENPFFQNETVANYTFDYQDRVYWSEVLDPLNMRAQNTFTVADVPGKITAIRATGDSLVVFKRNARWVFTSSEDVNYVALPVGGVLRGAGCLNPKAIDVADHDGALYYVGEDGVYRWMPGSQPEELCGEAMLREMFDKSTATWCESQASPANRALLTIDQKNKRLYVYVQKGRIYCYDIRRQAWSVLDAGGDSTVTARGYQICDMIYNPNTGSVYVAFTEAATGTAGLARLDATQAAARDQISSSGTLPVYLDIIPPPIEARPRADVFVERLFADIECTVSDQSATAYYSRDQGATFTATSTARALNTSLTNFEPERFVIAKGWGSITPRLLITGKAGTGALKLSGLSVDLRVDKQKEHPKRTI